MPMTCLAFRLSRSQQTGSNPCSLSIHPVPKEIRARGPIARVASRTRRHDLGIPQAKVFAVLRLPVSVVTDRSAYFSSDRLGVRCVTRWGFAFPHQETIIKIGVA